MLTPVLLVFCSEVVSCASEFKTNPHFICYQVQLSGFMLKSLVHLEMSFFFWVIAMNIFGLKVPKHWDIHPLNMEGKLVNKLPPCLQSTYFHPVSKH